MILTREGKYSYLTITGVNPEPWEIGQPFAKRHGGKLTAGISPSPKLRAYQDALREEVGEFVSPIYALDAELEVYFWFWRQIEEFKTPTGRTSHSNYADSTNLQKATEDALQDLVYGNDRLNRRVGSEIVAQSQTTQPAIVVRLTSYQRYGVSERVHSLVTQARGIDTERRTKIQDNSW